MILQGLIRYVVIVSLSLGFLLSATGEVLIVKTMNYGFDVALPVFNTIVMNLYLPIQLMIYIVYRRSFQKKDHVVPITAYYVSRQSMLAFISVGLNLFRYFALNIIPASIYVIVGTSDIFFNMVLSKIFLKKTFSIHQYFSALIVLVTIGIIGAGSKADIEDECARDSPEEADCVSRWIPGILFTLVGSFLAAVTSVGSEYLFRHIGKESNFQVVCEIGIFYAVFGIGLSPVPLFITGEQTKWSEKLGSLSTPALFILLCIGLAIAKLGFRNFKFGVISVYSAFYFAILNALKTLITLACAVLLLGEALTLELAIGFPLVAFALGLYLYGSYREEQRKKREKAKNALEAEMMPTSSLKVDLPLQIDAVESRTEQLLSPVEQQASSEFDYNVDHKAGS